MTLDNTNIALQWGRDQMVAEIPDQIVERCRRSIASMGPRPDGRGNEKLQAAKKALKAALQWGRDQMVAEMAAAT